MYDGRVRGNLVSGKTYEIKFLSTDATMFKLIGSYTDESSGTAYDQSIARIDPLTAGTHVRRFIAAHDYTILNSGLSPSSAVITNVELCIVEKPMSSGNMD